MSRARVAVLYSELAGYTIACLEALSMNFDSDLLVFHWPRHVDAPFDSAGIRLQGQLHDKSDFSTEELISRVRDFRPSVLLISGWMDKDYLAIARIMKNAGVLVVAACDTQWHGTVRQHLSRVASRWLLHSAIDILWVAGERQRQLAYKLGFRGEKCWSGCYSCDWDQFASEHRIESETESSFLFVGRYVNVKGIQLLVAAYHEYRAMTSEPWTLKCIGTGKLKTILETEEGITDLGFIQPSMLPEYMKTSSCFVLPSIQEPWGVVLHEAAASALPLICSDVCGASVHLVQDSYNGYIFESGNQSNLANCMVRMTKLLRPSRREMGERSFELSKQFTPLRWAEILVRGSDRC